MSGCWIWQLAVDVRGYGYIKVERKMYRTHRVAYEAFTGPIPEGFQIDHLCRNTSCINPQHLEAVTASVNTLRARAATGWALTCGNGHRYSSENICFTRRGTRLDRKCRQCRIAENRRGQIRRTERQRKARCSESRAADVRAV